MVKKQYEILLDDKRIGTTELEKADAPMGVVSGEIIFNNIVSGYEFFKKHCLLNKIGTTADYPEDRFIATMNIPNLKVFSENGIEIKGQAVSVEGFDNECFEIVIHY